MTRPPTQLRGAFALDQVQPQLAAALAVKGLGQYPVPGDSAYWIEVEPGLLANTLLDVALKQCDVRPGALLTERHFGTLEVHAADQGQVREAGRRMLRHAGLSEGDTRPPRVLFREIVQQVDAHHANLINKSRSGMLVLARDTLYTLEVEAAVWVLLLANEAEKAAPVRLVDIENSGAVGRLRLCGGDAEIRAAAEAVERCLSAHGGGAH
jgi:hypothetical protein